MQEIVTEDNPSGVRKFSIMAAMPAYNEERRIVDIVAEVKPFVDTVIVVDDGSKDKTVMVAENAGAMVFRHVDNKGYGGALQTIFKTAKKYKPDILIILDSDGQHNPADIPRFISKIEEGYDLVIGSRFLTQESKDSIPAYRKIGMKVLDKATDLSLSGIHVTDSQCGYRAYSREAYTQVNISVTGMSAGSEILVQITERKLAVSEIPIIVRYDLDNTSSQNPIRHGVSVLGNVIRFVTIKRPLLIFGLIGLVFFFLFVFVFIWSCTIHENSGIFPITMTIVAFMIFIVSMMFYMVGFVLFATVERNKLN